MVKNMNMHKVLENFIARYFEKKLMPGIRKKYREMEEKYGASGAGDGELGKDYYVNSFGFQTEFMMRYMTIAFGIVCLFLVATAFRIGGDAWNGAGIFGVFFGICLILWGICRIRRGYIVYNTRWISVSRGGHWADETMDRLSGISVTGNLTLTFGIEKNMARKISIPLEGGQYMDFYPVSGKKLLPGDRRDPGKSLCQGKTQNMGRPGEIRCRLCMKNRLHFPDKYGTIFLARTIVFVRRTKVVSNE